MFKNLKKIFSKKTKINVIKLQGVISSGKKNLNLSNTKKNIDKAFDNKKITAVALLINSPGGSPSQSEILANYLLKKSQESNIPLITFIEDVGASGGYWISLVSKQIFALANTSIIGSLGVLYSSFGLEDFIGNHGIKRRIHSAGDKKVTLDMFSKENPQDVERLKIMLESVHNHFKNWVISQRKDKLNIDEKDLFSGEFWIASEAKKLGLIDDVAITMEDKLNELYGSNIIINHIEDKKSKLANLFMLNKVNLIEESTQNAINIIKNELFSTKYKI